MRPVRLTIPGCFWDSFIYKGRLYLFERDGAIRTLDWDALIREWPLQKPHRLPLECAFARSDYLYGARWSLLFSDRELKGLLLRRFTALAAEDLVVPSTLARKKTIGVQDNPLPFPHADLTIYNGQVFAAGPSGLYRASCGKTRRPISQRPKKAGDMAAVALSANYGALALAAGDDGLFQLQVLPVTYNEGREPERLAESNATDCSWLYQSIFASSHVNKGVLAAFKREPAPLEPEDIYLSGTTSRRFLRQFERLIPQDEIFTATGYSWGNQDKICLARDRSVEVVRYQPWRDQPLQNLGRIRLANWKGDVVSARVAVFGTIIECERAVVVLLSDGSHITVRGEPVNWRVFPRSRHYENQLHLIYEERLDILSFNQDYFIDQETKISGISYPKRGEGDGGRRMFKV
jgi:hypothetical protein